jgi:hypothetical protein
MCAYDEPAPVWQAADNGFVLARLAPGVCALVYRARDEDGWCAGVQTANGTGWHQAPRTHATLEAAKAAALAEWARRRGSR